MRTLTCAISLFLITTMTACDEGNDDVETDYDEVVAGSTGDTGHEIPKGAEDSGLEVPESPADSDGAEESPSDSSETDELDGKGALPKGGGGGGPVNDEWARRPDQGG